MLAESQDEKRGLVAPKIVGGNPWHFAPSQKTSRPEGRLVGGWQ